MAAPGDGFLPRRVPIDAYGDDHFRFADMGHYGPILCLPSGVSAWAGGLSLADVAAILEEPEAIDILILGTGRDLRPLSVEVRQAFRARGTMIEAMATGPAVRTYNILLEENRRVAGAFLTAQT